MAHILHVYNKSGLDIAFLCPPRHNSVVAILTTTHPVLQNDYATYASLCDENLTCIEPETGGNITTGLEFHKYYFDLPRSPGPPAQNTMCDFSARIFGSVAVVTYNRVVQVGHETTVTQETRIWHSDDLKNWKNIHFHRSN